MPKMTQYAPGTPSWADIGTDVEGAKAFYSGLFGWQTQDAGPVDETGGYGFFQKNGQNVAGYGPQMNPGPPVWSTYITVADADQTAKAVETAGGTVVMAPMDVMTAGRMAVLQDPQGGFFSVWQPGEHIGAGLVNEPGGMCWNELNSRDMDGSKKFYSEVFGWDPLTHAEGPMPYTEWQLDGRSVGGAMDMPPVVPAEVPTNWLVYFAVDDTDAAVKKTEELGGDVRAPAFDTPAGRMAVLGDPQGAVFAVIKMAQAAS